MKKLELVHIWLKKNSLPWQAYNFGISAYMAEKE
jgi:hypothetical protein